MGEELPASISYSSESTRKVQMRVGARHRDKYWGKVA